MAITPGPNITAFPIATADAATNAADIRTAIGANDATNLSSGTVAVARGGTGLGALGTGVQAALGANTNGTGGVITWNSSPTLDRVDFTHLQGDVRITPDVLGIRFGRAGSSSIISWTSGVVASTGTLETGISPVDANTLGIGNGVAGNTSKNLSLTNLTASGTGSFTGALVAQGGVNFTGDCLLRRDGAATLQMGVLNATTPTAQVFKAHDVTTGTGANLTIANGKGSVAGGQIILATSATNGVPVSRIAIGPSGGINCSSQVRADGGLTVGTGTAIAKLRHGTATLVAGTVTVTDTATTANTRIQVNRIADGGTVGDSYSVTRSAGASFTVTSKTAGATQTLDVSTITYLAIDP